MNENGVVTAHSLMPDGGFDLLPGGFLEGWVATVTLPLGAHFLTVGLRLDRPHLWVVSAGGPGMSKHRFAVVQDGVTTDFILSGRDHVGSILPGAESDVAFHVFDITRQGGGSE